MKSDIVYKIKKYICDPKLIYRFVLYNTLKYIHHDIFTLPFKCEGLLHPFEVLYIYTTVKKISGLSGNILDFGSYKGLSTCVLSKAGVRCKKDVVAFESFQGLPQPSELDGGFLKRGEYCSQKKDFYKNINRYSVNNVKLIVGDVRETFKKEIEEFRIIDYSFAFIDTDLYDVIREILTLLDLIREKSNIVCIHDLNLVGVKAAVNDFVEMSKHVITVCNDPFNTMYELKFGELKK